MLGSAHSCKALALDLDAEGQVVAFCPMLGSAHPHSTSNGMRPWWFMRTLCLHGHFRAVAELWLLMG